jgi:hypothetical protein
VSSDVAEPTAPSAQKGTIYRSRWADLARSSGTLYVADAHHRVYVVDPDQMPIAGMPLDGWPPIHTPAQPPPPDEQAPPRQSEPTRGGAPPKTGVRSAVFWSYALTAGRVGTTTIVTFVLAKLLGPSEFGVVAMALLFLTIAQTLLQQGLVSAIIQREDLTDEHLDAAFVILLLSGLGMGVVMAAGSPLWALAFGEPQLTAVCLAFAPLLLVQALAVVPEAVLRRASSASCSRCWASACGRWCGSRW